MNTGITEIDKKLEHLANLQALAGKQKQKGLEKYYIFKMMKTAEEHNEPVSRAIEGKFCKFCFTLLLPGVTARFRVKKRGKTRKDG